MFQGQNKQASELGGALTVGGGVPVPAWDATLLYYAHVHMYVLVWGWGPVVRISLPTPAVLTLG